VEGKKGGVEVEVGLEVEVEVEVEVEAGLEEELERCLDDEQEINIAIREIFP